MAKIQENPLNLVKSRGPIGKIAPHEFFMERKEDGLSFTSPQNWNSSVDPLQGPKKKNWPSREGPSSPSIFSCDSKESSNVSLRKGVGFTGEEVGILGEAQKYGLDQKQDKGQSGIEIFLS